MGVRDWRDLIIKNADAYSFKRSLIAGMMDVESGGNPNAISSAGAVGLLQILPDSVIPGRPSRSQLLIPAFNVEYGVTLLSSLRQRYDNEDSALAAYFGAIDANGNPSTASDGSGVDGWGYIRLVRQRAVLYDDLDAAGSVGDDGGNGDNGDGQVPAGSSLAVPILALLAIWIVVS